MCQSCRSFSIQSSTCDRKTKGWTNRVNNTMVPIFPDWQNSLTFPVSFSIFQYFYRPQRSWAKVIFSQACVKNSVHGGGGEGGCLPQCMVGYTPKDQAAPPGTRQTPPSRHHPPGSGSPPGTRQTTPPPPGQANPPPGPGRPPMPPSGADTPQAAPLGTGRPPLGPGRPPLSRHHPPDQAAPPTGSGRPPWDQVDPPTPQSRHPPGRPPWDQPDTPQVQPYTPPGSRLQHTVYKRLVHILLECILVNALFFKWKLDPF